MSTLTAAIMAGGGSTRMGQDKAMVRFAGQTLMERAVLLARSLAENILIVGREESPCPGIVAIPDLVPGQGPLAGIATALHYAQTERVICLVLDQPLMTVELAGKLVDVGESDEAAVFKEEGFVHPFPCAVARSVLPQALLLLERGRRRILHLLERVKTHYVLVPSSMEVQDAFINVNTPDDLERARSVLATRTA